MKLSISSACFKRIDDIWEQHEAMDMLIKFSHLVNQTLTSLVPIALQFQFTIDVSLKSGLWCYTSSNITLDDLNKTLF